jgi:hypothetical protein
VEAFFDPILLAVEPKYLVMGKRPVIGNQQGATLATLGQRLLIVAPVEGGRQGPSPQHDARCP